MICDKPSENHPFPPSGLAVNVSGLQPVPFFAQEAGKLLEILWAEDLRQARITSRGQAPSSGAMAMVEFLRTFAQVPSIHPNPLVNKRFCA